MINIPKILILAVIQGVTELLPVSSSAHVIVAEKLMGLDPTKPEMTLLLVMLHAGTMLAVIVFFWNSWKANFLTSQKVFLESVKFIIMATIATGFVGLLLKVLIEKILLKGVSHPEVELLFGNLPLISAALAAVGVLILWAGYKDHNRVLIPDTRRSSGQHSIFRRGGPCVRPMERAETSSASTCPIMDPKAALLMGMVQGICLPFRGFSRSGATISTGLILGVEKRRVEDFSFALAVILTPPVILMEALRFLKVQHAHAHHGTSVIGLFLPSLMGMVLSFISGILALQWLSNWLERGRWYLFGIYCLCASGVIFFLHCQGL
jgi:undecaprenyl-diphosphatase